MQSKETRTIIAHTLEAQNNSGGILGFVKPIAEIIDDKLIEINKQNFCQTMKVFIIGGYDNLERSYPDGMLFKLTINLNDRPNEKIDPTQACQYISSDRFSEPIKPKDYFEIIEAELPDANFRQISLVGPPPGTRYIFIGTEKSLYGPFKWNLENNTNDTLTLNFVDSKLPSVNLLSYQIYSINQIETKNQIFTTKNDKNIRRFIQGLSIISSADYYDYASDEEVIRFTAKLASDANIKLVEKRKLSDLAGIISRNPSTSHTLHRQRLNRLIHISADAIQMQTDAISAFSEYLKNDNGKVIVQNFIDKNQPIYLENFKKEREAAIDAQFETKQKEIKAAEDRLKTLNESKIELSSQVEELKRASKQEAVIDKAYAEADSNLQNKKLALNSLERLIDEKSLLAHGLKDFLDIQSGIEVAKSELKIAKQREYDQKRALEETNRELKKSESELRLRLTDLKPFVDAINGAFAPHIDGEAQVDVDTNNMKSGGSLLELQKEIIGEVGRRLAEQGRSMPDWQVANILISTQQSFITFLAGMPGVGKTSLARLLAQVQNIAPKRLAEVAVGRGWTSQKDLIGFYNPLTSRFQPSGTGMYTFLTALSTEKSSKAAMAYVLLDEANLSPIEHYWSTFMGMTDGGRNNLHLGDKMVLVPEHLRFIATINYDGTTEPLSPRIVDRAPIIMIDSDEFGSDQDDRRDQVINPASLALPLSACDMQELFGNVTNEPELESEENVVFERIRKTLRDSDTSLGRPILISARKIHAIKQYCAKAGGIMNIDSELLALDLALVQHVLPLVRGNGPGFARRLENLQRELESTSLNRSAKCVKTMLFNGAQDLHTYDFFCW